MEEQKKKEEEQIWRPGEPEYIPPKRYEIQLALKEEEEHW